MPWKRYSAYIGPNFMLLLSIYILYSNVTYTYPVSCHVEMKLFQIVSVLEVIMNACKFIPKNFVSLCLLWEIHLNGCRSELVNVMSVVPQGSVLGQLLFLLFTSEIFSVLENILIAYADDSFLIVVVPSPGIRVTVAEALIHDIG